MILGITGHQEIGDQETVQWVTETLRGLIISFRPRLGLTSLAKGADQIFAGLLLGSRIPFHVVIPCEDYESTFSIKEDLDAYRRFLVSADKSEVLPFSAPSEHAFFAAGKKIVDKCDQMVAIWNGLPAKGIGGTADVVAYAKTRRKPLVHVDMLRKSVIHL